MKTMKVLGQSKYTGHYTQNGEQKEYTKCCLIVEKEINGTTYCDLEKLPADTPDLRGKTIELLYKPYIQNGQTVYKASGYNIVK